MEKNKSFLPCRVQFFADPPADPQNTAEPPAELPVPAESPAPDNKPPVSLTAETVSEMIQTAMQQYMQTQQAQQTEAEKLAGMTEAEKTAYALKQANEQLAEMKRKEALAEMQKTARGILAGKQIGGISDELIAMIVTDNAETTQKNVDDFAEMYTKAVEDGVRERLKGNTPKAGSSGAKLTKEEILAITDDDKRLKAIQENIDLF